MNSDDKKVVDLYTIENLSTYEIANRLNTYPNKVRRILVKNKVKIKNKSEAQKNALSNGTAKIPTQGRERTQEEKISISKSMSKKWATLSDEEYNERVNKAKERWDNMSASERQHMNEKAIKAIQKAGKEGSKLEKFIREELQSHGYKIEPHKKNLVVNENLEIDMYLPQLKAIIEIDGPSHFLPIWGEEKLQKQIKADLHKTGLILSKGFLIIRVKNLADSISLSAKEDLKQRLLTVLQDIEKSFPSKANRYIEIEA